jgi:hypothetical protein
MVRSPGRVVRRHARARGLDGWASSSPLADLGLVFLLYLRKGAVMSGKYSAEWWDKLRVCNPQQADISSELDAQAEVSVPLRQQALTRAPNDLYLARAVWDRPSAEATRSSPSVRHG